MYIYIYTYIHIYIYRERERYYNDKNNTKNDDNVNSA